MINWMDMGSHIFSGRKKLITTLLPRETAIQHYGATPITGKTLEEDLHRQLAIHAITSQECTYLIDYYKGKQPILEKYDENRTNDVHTVINFAHAVSRNISAYTYSGGVQYVSANPEYFDAVKIINDFMKRENKDTVSKEVQDYQSICGTAYMAILPDSIEFNDVPFELRFLSPVSTFVVYSSFNTNVAVYGCAYYESKENESVNKFYQVFTRNEVYIFQESGVNQGNEFTLVEHKPHILGSVPIVEFPNNAFRLGDFEVALSLLDSINALSSDCLYNINSVVTSYLALFGVDLEDGDLESMKENRVMWFKGAQGINQDAKFIHMQLDGTSTEFLRNYLESALKFIVGIPDRDSGQVGSDTGAAAELRTGQGDLETVAKTKALYAVMGERKILDIALNILSPRCIPPGLRSSEIDVEITRINRSNMLTKTQSMLNLHQMGFEESDVVFFGNITNDVAGVAQRWKGNKEKAQIAHALEQADKVVVEEEHD